MREAFLNEIAEAWRRDGEREGVAVQDVFARIQALRDPDATKAAVSRLSVLKLGYDGWRFAVGWNEARLLERVYEIFRFAQLNSRKVIPLDRRRRIARLADEMLAELQGLGGLPEGFLDALRALAGTKPEWRTDQQRRSNRGGDRRSGERTLEGSVLGMIVRVYCEAHHKPAFSEGGPLVRFANAVGRDVLSVSGKPFTSNAVKAEFRRMKSKVRRPRGMRSIYKTMSEG